MIAAPFQVRPSGKLPKIRYPRIEVPILDIAERGEDRRDAADFERVIGNVKNKAPSLVEPIGSLALPRRRASVRRLQLP